MMSCKIKIKSFFKCILGPENESPEEVARTYVIDRLNIGATENDLDSDSD